MYYRLLLEHEEDGIVWDQTFNELLIPDLKQLIRNIYIYINSDRCFKKHITLDTIIIDDLEINEHFTIVEFTINSNSQYKLHINKLSLVCHECGELSNIHCKSCGQPLCPSHDYNGECEACIVAGSIESLSERIEFDRVHS